LINSFLFILGNKEKYTDPLSEDLHRKLDEGNALYRTGNIMIHWIIFISFFLSFFLSFLSFLSFLLSKRENENKKWILKNLIRPFLYKVNTTLEALRDSRFLATTANYAAIQAQRLKSTFVTFDGNVMMNKVVSILGGRDVGQEEDYNLDFNWENLSKIIMKNSKRVPNVDFL